MNEVQANLWLIDQVDGVHYRQEGDELSLCGNKWGKFLAARDFVTCQECRRLIDQPRR